MISTDVDIDVFNRDKILSKLDCTFGSILNNGKHNTGVYFQNIPKDPTTNLSTINYKDAAALGYFKIDFLNVHIYEKIKNESHLISLINKEPLWEMFEYTEITDQLFQLNGHSKLLQKFKPTSVEDLAIILAIIRPAKAHLRSEEWDYIKQEVWKSSVNDEYIFKKSHSLAYSLAVCVHLNLLMEELIDSTN